MQIKLGKTSRAITLKNHGTRSYLLCFLFFLYYGWIDAQQRPNVVLIFADDAGYADFGFHGSRSMITPNLDRLAKRGIRCTQAYVTDPTCGPSRAGLMTGRYQQRFGFEENNVPGFMSAVSALDGADMGLPTEEKTMGEYLQAAGYQTGYFGKWHLGGTAEYHPTNRGFDHFYGFRTGARSYFPYAEDPADSLKRMERGDSHYAEFEGYLTDVLAEDAVAFI
ncbi:MAG: sulfatase-like hydrolase/transferase, partial [Saprospiraceae bacterium]|nr:sulfatase-like hydrolase/transferase [Saprospiraceae bacterium]